MQVQNLGLEIIQTYKERTEHGCSLSVTGTHSTKTADQAAGYQHRYKRSNAK